MNFDGRVRLVSYTMNTFLLGGVYPRTDNSQGVCYLRQVSQEIYFGLLSSRNSICFNYVVECFLSVRMLLTRKEILSRSFLPHSTILYFLYRLFGNFVLSVENLLYLGYSLFDCLFRIFHLFKY